MTDDKAFNEAGLAYAKANPFLTRADHDEAMRAALAAADKVRAEGEFDAQKEYDRWLDDGSIKDLMEHCFAAGLAKGAAERAALVEALEQIRAWPGHTRDDLADTVQRMQIVAKDALTLVRKGV